ncbi:MAG TPA: right-handed parallel beta-helix repeat-containing protein [Allosphingosinicella sp.]
MKTRLASVAAIAVAATMVYATPASAQATRTWVSGTGDDVNPCSRTAPCKTFAGAISKTAAGGEINCLDPGGYGAVSIIKSMTIACPYTEGGALAGGNGITVNMPATTDVTFIRGLDIFGVNPPSNGIRMVNNGTLHVEDSVIRRFNAVNSAGISIAPTGAAELYINNVTVAENGNGATGGGIVIAPGIGGSVKANITNSRVRNNANFGVRADTTNGSVALVVDNTDISGNASGLSLQSGSALVAFLTNSIVANNSTVGVVGNGPSIALRAHNNTITGNTLGVSPLGGAQLLTYGNNRLVGNPSVGAANDGAFVGGAQPTQ